MKLEFDFIGDTRRIGKQVVSMNPKLGRIVIYQKTLDVMKKETKKDEIKFVRLATANQCTNTFFIQPCNEGEPSSRQVHAMGSTRMISAKLLFKKLEEKGWYSPKTKTEQFEAEWDKDNGALRVDLNKPSIPREETENIDNE